MRMSTSPLSGETAADVAESQGLIEIGNYLRATEDRLAVFPAIRTRVHRQID